MKHRAGQHHAPKARHPLLTLLRFDTLRDDDNREFLDMLYRSRHTIFQICLHFTDQSPDAIRDLYQEIACNLWEAWPRFRGDSSTHTWVRRIALNVAVTEVRRHAKQPSFVPLEDWMYDTIADPETAVPPDYYRLLSALEPDERALIYFRLEHLSIREIAQTLSTTEAAVKQRLYRLRQKLNDLKTTEDE